MTRLKVIRAEKGMTQDELAYASGVTQCIISKIESGQSKNPHVETLFKLSQALGCSLDDLIVPNNG